MAGPSAGDAGRGGGNHVPGRRAGPERQGMRGWVRWVVGCEQRNPTSIGTTDFIRTALANCPNCTIHPPSTPSFCPSTAARVGRTGR